MIEHKAIYGLAINFCGHGYVHVRRYASTRPIYAQKIEDPDTLNRPLCLSSKQLPPEQSCPIPSTKARPTSSISPTSSTTLRPSSSGRTLRLYPTALAAGDSMLRVRLMMDIQLKLTLSWIRAIYKEYHRRRRWIQFMEVNARRLKWPKLYLRQAVRLTDAGIFESWIVPVYQEETTSREDCARIADALADSFGTLGLKLAMAEKGPLLLAYARTRYHPRSKQRVLFLS